MKVKALLLLAVAALPMAGCANDGSGTPGAGTSPTSTATTGTGSAGRDGCLIGTWNVDVNDMAQQTATKMGRGATGTGTGTITLIFGDQMTIKYNNAIAIDSPIGSGLTMNMKNTFAGDATSTDWTAKDGKLAGTMPANTVTSTIVTTVGGKEVPATTTPLSGSLDMSSGALGYTCGGNKATLITPMVTWNLTKA
ncbi:MAG TPA: hypothetical protein DGG94_10040 [Micromonosporaceae bacterium]|nr:hypothetical protein [Micromonosporaceae bacterium]HCU50123.1 hypothetical protein [Micromonosporaceae bacterium]